MLLCQPNPKLGLFLFRHGLTPGLFLFTYELTIGLIFFMYEHTPGLFLKCRIWRRK